jgi:hypothetical protein
MDLGEELCQALRAYADGLSDARTTYVRLTRLGPALDASGDAELFGLWEEAFTLLSELNHGDEADAATRAELRRLLEASNNTIDLRATPVRMQHDS